MPIPRDVAANPRTLLRDRAFTLLQEAIVDGTLEPGEQLREAELQRWIGVSRTPIREALMRLQQVGLVVTRPGHSTVVSELDGDRVRDAQAVVAAMHELAVRAAVPNLTGDHLETMREANRRFAQALERHDADAALAADDDLHDVCVHVAGNAVVREVLDQHAPLLRRVERAWFSSDAAGASVRLHEDLIADCAAGDEQAAARVVLDTWQRLDPTATGDVSAGHGRLHCA